MQIDGPVTDVDIGYEGQVKLVPYGALTATFHTAMGCLLCPSILYFIVNAMLR